MDELSNLSRRERQIMELVYARGAVSATDVLEGMEDAPTRTAVRTFLRILEEKGHLRHDKQGREFVYRPVWKRELAGQSALQRLLRTFFDGSLEKAVASHLADPETELTKEQRERLAALIGQARIKGNK